jgi:hypothetical protein
MADLERFLREFMAKDHDSLVMDDDKWITIHPNGTDNRAVMIDDKTGVIKKGLAIGLIGTKLKDIRDNFKDKAKIEQHKARAEGEKAPEPVKDPEFEKYIESLKNTKQYGSFRGIAKKVNDAILKDIEERGITTMEGVNQLLKENIQVNYRLRKKNLKRLRKQKKLKNLRQKKKKEPEKKEPEKKEDDSKTIEGYLLKNGGKLWNDRRIYIKDIAKKLLNIKDDYHNTGNLRSFEWEDGKESNGYGRKVLSAIGSSYFDVNSQTFKCDSLHPEIDKLVIDKLNEKAKEMGLTVKEKPVITGNTVKDQIRRFVVDGWNGKVYRYKNGDNAIFVNNQKILLTKEQLDYIDSTKQVIE